MTAKTIDPRSDEAAACIRALHDYKVPEIVALPATAGSADYLDEARSETDGA